MIKLIRLFRIHKNQIKYQIGNIKKQIIVRYFGNKYKIPTLIETGTYLGDMINASKNTFKKIYSIEIEQNLYQKAKERFAKFQHIYIIHGDSAQILKKLLANINDRCLFWLDGHYSGGITGRGDKNTPIEQELDAIINHHIKSHVILIDDARLFTGYNDYPSIEIIVYTVQSKSNYKIEVKNDIIQIYV